MTTDIGLAGLVRGLGESFGIEGLELDAQQGCTLQIDQRFLVSLQGHGFTDELWFHADLGVPAQGPDAYLGLLRANLFWRSTGGATLSLSDDTPPSVVVALPVAWRNHDAASLAGALERFVQTLERCGEELSSGAADATTSGTASSGSPAERMEVLLAGRP